MVPTRRCCTRWTWPKRRCCSGWGPGATPPRASLPLPVRPFCGWALDHHPTLARAWRLLTLCGLSRGGVRVAPLPLHPCPCPCPGQCGPSSQAFLGWVGGEGVVRRAASMFLPSPCFMCACVRACVCVCVCVCFATSVWTTPLPPPPTHPSVRTGAACRLVGVHSVAGPEGGPSVRRQCGRPARPPWCGGVCLGCGARARQRRHAQRRGGAGAGGVCSAEGEVPASPCTHALHWTPLTSPPPCPPPRFMCALIRPPLLVRHMCRSFALGFVPTDSLSTTPGARSSPTPTWICLPPWPPVWVTSCLRCCCSSGCVAPCRVVLGATPLRQNAAPPGLCAAARPGPWPSLTLRAAPSTTTTTATQGLGTTRAAGMTWCP